MASAGDRFSPRGRERSDERIPPLPVDRRVALEGFIIDWKTEDLPELGLDREIDREEEDGRWSTASKRLDQMMTVDQPRGVPSPS